MTRTAHIRNPIEGVVYATEAATEGWLKSGACVKVSQFVQHEIIESIYFRDPNWYPLEITRSLRDVEEPDAVDATATRPRSNWKAAVNGRTLNSSGATK